MATRIKIRNDTGSNWESRNPILAKGEIGLVIDGSLRRAKVGDGITPWNALDFAWEAVGGTGGATAFATLTDKASADLPAINNPLSTALGALSAQLSGKAPATGISPAAISGTAVITTDPRLSDARTPTAHTHPASEISDATATGRSILTAANQAAARSSGLGSGATGDQLFQTLTPAAARAVLEIDRTRTRAVLVEVDFYNSTDTSGMTFTSFSAGTAAFSAGTSTPNHPGILRMASGGSTNSGARLRHDASAMVLAGGEVCEWVFQIQSLSNGVTAYIGFTDTNSNTAPSHGVWAQFNADGTTLTCSGKAAAGSTPVTTATTYSAAINTWYSLTVELNANATVATFTLRSEAGAVLWTDTVSSAIPTGRNSLGFTAFNVNNSAVSLALIDYARLEINRTLTR